MPKTAQLTEPYCGLTTWPPAVAGGLVDPFEELVDPASSSGYPLQGCSNLRRSASEQSVFSVCDGDSEIEELLLDSQSRVETLDVQVTNFRDTRPLKPVVWGKPSHSYLERDDVGNIGFSFFNLGERAATETVRLHQDMTLRKNPAAIIGMSECALETRDILNSPAVAGSSEKGDKFAIRAESEYMCIRGNEKSSVLLAVRANVAEKLEMLYHERKSEGTYKSKSGIRSQAYTRVLVGKIFFSKPVGQIGMSMVVMVLHLHHHVANNFKGFRHQQKATWPWLAQLIIKYEVDLLMGDLNMSFFKTVPELRSCGVKANLAAWYPWKAERGLPMSDSCGIWWIGGNVDCKLSKGIDTVHKNSSDGVLRWQLDENHFDHYKEEGGPGMSLDKFLPKSEDNSVKILNSFGESSPAVAGQKRLALKQKWLDHNIFRVDGVENRRGSHFPVCVFTVNNCRRSVEGMRKRNANKWEKYEKRKGSHAKESGAAVAAP